MPITIRELLASDTISQAADKINFNFDQLLLNGGGPQGPQGPQGPPGPIGGRGIRGSVWYEGTVPPTATFPTTTPEDEDNYLQSNGFVWTYDASIPGWVNTGINLTGPVGPPGASGKFAEYQALPYTAAGDTTIFPDEISLSPIGITQGVRSVLIGGFPETVYNLTPPITAGTNIVPNAIASQLQMPDISMMVHQFDSTGRGIVFHGGDATEDFEQSLVTNLSSIGISNDDLMVISVPKAPTLASTSPDLDGLRVLTPSRNQHFQAGKRIWLQAGTNSTQYGAGDLASVWIETDRNNASIPDPTIELRVYDSSIFAYEAELRLGGSGTVPVTSSKQGDFWVEAGSIGILSSGNTTVNSGQGINMTAVNDIVATSSSGDISLNAPSGELFSTSQTVDVNATDSIDIDATNDIDVTSSSGDISLSAVSGEFSSTSQTVDVNATATIDVIGAGLVTVQSTGNDLNLFATGPTSEADLYAVQDIRIHSKDADVNIFTDTGTGGNVFIDTSTTGTQIRLQTANPLSPIELITNGDNSDIRLETIGDKAPINLITNDDDGAIKLETIGGSAPIELITGTGSSPIVLDANNGGAPPTNIDQGGLRAYSLLRSQGNFYIGAGTASYTFPAAPLENNIVLNAQDNIELRANSTNGSILIQSGGNGSSIDLQRVTGTSVVNVFSTSGAGSYFTVWGGDDPLSDNGIRLWMNGTGASQNIANITALGGTDRINVGSFDGQGSAQPYDSGFKVDANNHLTHFDRIASGVGVNDDIFRSGQFVKSYTTTPSIPSDVQIKINWMRVGNVVTGTGFMDPTTSIAVGNYDVDIPIGEAAANTVYGMWTDIDFPPTAPYVGAIGYFSSTRMRIAIAGVTPPGIHFTFSYVIA